MHGEANCKTNCDPAATGSKRSIWRPGRGQILGVVAAMILVLASIIAFAPLDEGPRFEDPRFIPTNYPQLKLPEKPTIADRLRFRWEVIRLRIFGPTRRTVMPVISTQKCHVFGILNQCMSYTDTRFYVEERVARGSVSFGTTTTLTPVQWEAAFKSALETQPVEWWDASTKEMKLEPLLLMTNQMGCVLVMPKSMAAEFSTAM